MQKRKKKLTRTIFIKVNMNNKKVKKENIERSNENIVDDRDWRE